MGNMPPEVLIQLYQVWTVIILGVKSGYICQRKKQYRFTTNGKKAEMQFSHSKHSVLQFHISNCCT